VVKLDCYKYYVKTRCQETSSEDEGPSCDLCCSEDWSMWFSETVIITVLKSVAKKRLVKLNDFM
jgi:hypothetical protein